MLNSGIFTLKEFYNRGVVKLAPDVLVYIGGSLEATVIAPINSSNSSLSFSDGITNVSVQNNLDPPGSSSASIEIATPIYGRHAKYWTTYKACENHPYDTIKKPIFGPMMEVKVFFKGRFLVDMRPRYYPAFWGFINNIEESYSGGMYKTTLGCVDILHWWAYSTINVHPVPESNIMAGGSQPLSVYSTTFEKSNPFEIIYQMTSQMGMQEFVTAAWVAQKTQLDEIYPLDQFKKDTAGIMSYWQQRFSSIGGLLKMYGLNGKRVDKRGVQTVIPNSINPNVNKDSEASAAMRPQKYSFSTDNEFLRSFMVFADFQNMGTFQAAEYTTKLEIATEVKTRCEYEFFQDQNGNFVFKPPFYNVNVKGLIPYTLLPSDIISYSFNTDIENICTVMTLNTAWDKMLKQTSFALGKGFHMDIDLAKRYGIRYKEMTLQYVTDEHMAKSLAVGHMGVINAKTINGSVTIPGRPEIRLGYPVYVEHRDSFHYVKSINHSFDYGGSFTTTLALETERRQVPIPDVNTTLKATATNKNKVYRYFSPVGTTAAPDVIVQTTEAPSVPPAPLPGLGTSVDTELEARIADVTQRIADLASIIAQESVLSNSGNRAEYDSLQATLRELQSQKSPTTITLRKNWDTLSVMSPEYIAQQKKFEEDTRLNSERYNAVHNSVNFNRWKAMQGTQDAPTMATTDPEELKKQELLTSEQQLIANKQGLYKIDDLNPRALSDERSVTSSTVPYSDEQGYKVVGSFPYGRNINPILIANDIEDMPKTSVHISPEDLRSVYLATMARPIYRNESEAMAPLFLDNSEGAVPTYLGDPQGNVPSQLGRQGDVDFDALNKTKSVISDVEETATTPAPTPPEELKKVVEPYINSYVSLISNTQTQKAITMQQLADQLQKGQTPASTTNVVTKKVDVNSPGIYARNLTNTFTGP